MPMGVLSPSSSNGVWSPNAEPLRVDVAPPNRDFGVFRLKPIFFPGSPPPLTLAPNFPGVGLGAYRPTEGRPGVDNMFCCFRKGDSGLGRDGLGCGLK